MRRPPLTRFFCQESLYDYVCGNLTSERKKEIDEYLETDEVCRHDLEKLQLSIQYCRRLRTIQTPDVWVERWRNLPPALAKRLSGLEMQVGSKLWTALPYFVTLAVIVLGMMIFKPWKTLFSRETVVWSVAALTPEPSQPELSYGDVYEASLTIADFKRNIDLLEKKIPKLKGEKIEKSGLEAQHGKGVSEFDFTLPESNLDELSDFLATLGPVRISKQNHPVVMPPGKIRIILTLKEDADHDSEAPSP